MKILAFDTCCGQCSVAIYQDSTEMYYLKEQKQHMQTEKLVPMIEDGLREAKIWYNDLNCIAVTVGPGSFTGVRIGLACSYGIDIAANRVMELDIINAAFSTLHVMAYGILHKDNIGLQKSKIAIALEAGRDECYIQEFTLNDRKIVVHTNDLTLMSQQDAKVRYSKIYSNFKDFIGTEFFKTPDARDLALLTRSYLKAGIEITTPRIPIYVREASIHGKKEPCAR